MSNLLNPQWTEALGLTLLDSLWQGALILLIGFLLLLSMKKSSPAIRFKLVLVAMLAMPLISVVTFVNHLKTQQINASQVPNNFSFISNPDFIPFVSSGKPLSTTLESTSPIMAWKLWAQKNAVLAMSIWLTGALLFTVRMLGGFVFLNRLKIRSKPISHPYWNNRVVDICKQLKINGKVLLKQVEGISSPLVMGVLQPAIIFPIGLIQALPTEQIEAILVHEIAHIKRKDFLINIVINVLQVVYFYHPAFWWLNARLDDEREFDCDENAMHLSHGRLTLIKALASVSEFQNKQKTPALAFAGRKNQMLKRVQRIAKKQPQTNWLSGLLSFGLLLSSFFLMSYSSELPQLEDKESTRFDLQPSKNTQEEPSDFFLSQSQMEAIPQDTGRVAEAIVEILKPNSPIEIEVKRLADGQMLMIKKNGNQLKGKEFEVYEQAYRQIQDFNTTLQNKTREADLERAELEIKEATTRLKEINKIGQVELNEAVYEELKQQFHKQLKELEEQLQQIKNSGSGTDKIEVSVSEINKKAQELMKAHELIELEMNKIEVQRNENFELELKKLMELINSKATLINQKDSIVFELEGKILTKEEMDTLIPRKLTVVEVLDAHKFKQSPTAKEKTVQLVKLKAALNGTESGLTIVPVDTEGKSVRERFRIGLSQSQNKDVFYELDGKIVPGKIFQSLDADKIETLQVVSSLQEIEKLQPQIAREGVALVRISTKKGSSIKSNTVVLKRPYTATAISHDYYEIEFGNIISQKEQLDLSLGHIKNLTPMIELNGKLMPDWTYDNIYNLESSIQMITIAKGKRMYDFYKRSLLRKKDVLLKVTTR